MHPTAVVPIKGFTVAKERLDIPVETRAALAQATAAHVLETCLEAGLAVIVVTSDDHVADMGRSLGATIVADPGGGLDAAVTSGVATATPWLVLHGDLPLLDVASLARASEALDTGTAPIGPARDGGTNLIGGHGEFRFAYGTASFHRHLGTIARSGRPPRILVSEAIATEVDTIRDLTAAASRPGGEWLGAFLS